MAFGVFPPIPTIPTIPPILNLFHEVEVPEPTETSLYSSPVDIQTDTISKNDIILNEMPEIIYTLINDERVIHGISPLIWDDRLARLAVSYSARMVEQNFFSHTDPDGHDQSDRAKTAGYITIKKIAGEERIGVSENIAYMGTGDVIGYGYVDPTDPYSIASAIVNGWMNSPGHRSNILDPLSNRTGVGASFNGSYWFATQEFY